METTYGVFPEAIRLDDDRAARVITVRTRFYEVRHDLARGGAITAITYLNGSNRNLLVQPMAAALDPVGGWGFTDLHESQPDVTAVSDAEEVRLTFAGMLRNGDGKDAGVRYEFSYRYRWGYVRVTKRFRFPAAGLAVRRLSVLNYVLRPELSYWAYRPAPEAEPSADPFAFAVCQWGRTRVGADFDCAFETRFIPRYVASAEPGREGLEWFASSRLEEWSYQLTGHAGHGGFTIDPRVEAGGVGFDFAPLCLRHGGATLRGPVEFTFCQAFPIITGQAHEPFIHASFNRHEWPTDAALHEWAEKGVRTAHFHHDGDCFDDGLFWHDGTYPPFGPADMAEYDRVLRTCRTYGIRTATYFSNKELHPSTAAYQQHGEEWGRQASDTGAFIHNYYRKDEFGAQMCLRSGWLDYLKSYIDTVLTHHRLDGIYYDWNVGLYCHNPRHAGAAAAPPAATGLGAIQLSPLGHWDMDELLDLMEWTRRRVGPTGLVIVHNTMVPCAAVENFSDYVVAMEWGYGRLSTGIPRPENLPLEWNFMGARSRGVIGYGTLMPNAPKSLERQLTLLALVTGVVPWTASETTLELFRPLKGLAASRYRFLDWRSSPARCGNPNLVSAAYVRPGEALILVANLSAETQAGACRLSLEALGLPPDAACEVRRVAPGAQPVAVHPENGVLPLTVDGAGLVVIEVGSR